MSKLKIVIGAVILLSVSLFAAYATGTNAKYRNPYDWHVEVLVLDAVSIDDKIWPALDESAEFIKKFSKFKVSYGISEYTGPHTYSHYDCSEGPLACVVVSQYDIPQDVLMSMPGADAYLFIWKAYDQPPLHAGSTFPPEYGIERGGVKIPYSSVAADPWWYTGDPFEGFNRRDAQIITHEMIHTINGVLHATYDCDLMSDTPGLPAYEYESGRLQSISRDCYLKLVGR